MIDLETSKKVGLSSALLLCAFFCCLLLMCTNVWFFLNIAIHVYCRYGFEVN